MTKARDLANIISGGFTFEDIPNIPASKITSGTIDTSRISGLAASAVSSGTFADARIPDLAASKITSGTFSDSRLPSTALNSNVDLTNLSASNMTSGTLPDARFPAALPAVSGANLTNLPASTGVTASSYSGSTAWWMQSLTWSSNNSFSPNTFVKTGSFSFHATDSANAVNDKTILTNSFEGSFTDTGPNTGTRGLGDHHTNANFFAWVRHPESSGNPGFRQDTRGNASGYLWVK